jgi:hypothetical protein
MYWTGDDEVLFLLLRSADIKGQDFGMLYCVLWLCFFHCCHSYWPLKLFVHGSGNNQQWSARSAVLLVAFGVLRVFESENRKEVGIIWWHSVVIFMSSHIRLYSVIWCSVIGRVVLMFQRYVMCLQHQDVFTEWPSVMSLAALLWQSQILHEGAYFSWFSFLVCQLCNTTSASMCMLVLV